MSKPATNALCVLMAEDSDEDVFFVKRALSKANIAACFHAVPDGARALDYLKAGGEFSDREKYPFPNFLICDLKMPRMDGYAVLHWLQEHPNCRVIPTVVFSSSALEGDVKRCYALGANAYLQKPGTLEDLADALTRLFRFWSNCEIPEPPPGGRCH